MVGLNWRHGLYGRIALWFIGLTVLVLAVQGASLVWVIQQWTEADRASQRFRLDVTRRLANELSAELAVSPDLDLAQRIAKVRSPGNIFIVLKDGQVIGRRPAASVIDLVLPDLKHLKADDQTPIAWERSTYSASLLKVGGEVEGVIGIVPLSMFRRTAPLLGAIGLTVAAIGIFISSLAVVGPIRARLGDLKHAAHRLEHGELNARARSDGKDEVAQVAKAFNAMAEELSRRTTALETSDRLRRQLIADVSHELMTPLTAVLGHLETLSMEEVRLDETQRRRQVGIATREAKRLQRLIGDLIDAARLEAGGVQIHPESISARELFRQVALRHEHECRARRIDLQVSVGDDADRFNADPFRTEQALDNMIVNALRHTPEGGRISMRSTRQGQSIILEVADSGEGIAAEHLPFIFDRFYKATSVRGIASPGSGLGLSIVKAIVTRHGGSVSASSTPGAGTVIRMQIPLRDSVPTPTAA